MDIVRGTLLKPQALASLNFHPKEYMPPTPGERRTSSAFLPFDFFLLTTSPGDSSGSSRITFFPFAFFLSSAASSGTSSRATFLPLL
jgi:hypothetical protein